MKKILLIALCVFTTAVSFGQDIYVVGQIDGDWGPTHQMSNYTLGGSDYYYVTVAATGNYADAAWLFEADAYYNKWNEVTANVNIVNSYTWNANYLGSDNIIDSDVTSGFYYTFRLQDNGYADANGVVMETSASPISISSVSQVGSELDNSYYSNSGSQTVNITLSGSKSAEENIYIRYSTDGWSTDNWLLATGSGTSYSGSIPGQSVGTTINYYVLTTTLTSSGSGDLDNYPDLCTINYDNNSGNNYSYIVARESTSDGDWNSTSTWLDGVIPSGTTDDVIISNNVTVDEAGATDAECENIIIESGATLTLDNSGDIDKKIHGTVVVHGTADVRSGSFLDIDGQLKIKSTGNLYLEPNGWVTVDGTVTNEGSLTVEADATGNGSIILNTAGITATWQQYIDNNDEWHFVSVPFTGTMPEICDANWAPATGSFNQAVGETYDFYFLDEEASSDYWVNIKNDSWGVNTTDFGDPPRFVKGQGYLVAYSSSFAGSDTKSSSGSLTGSANVLIPFTATSLTYNLVGNPFPSTIDWKDANWGRSNLVNDGGYSFWIWNGASGQFGTYNSGSGSDDGTNGTSRYISPGQGFYVQASSAGNLNVNTSARTHTTKTLLKNTNSNKQLKLVLTGVENPYSDELIIEFGHENNEGGSQKLASLYTTAPSLSTSKAGGNYSIDFRTDETDQNIINVAFAPGLNGTYTITAIPDDFDEVYLKDKKTNEVIDIKLVGSYTFTSSVDDVVDRFDILFSAVGIDESRLQSLQVFSTSGGINFVNNENLEGDINIVNVMGQSIYNGILNGNSKQIVNTDATTGIYIVNIKTNDGSSISKKVIIN
jgi:hypothetical protein